MILVLDGLRHAGHRVSGTGAGPRIGISPGPPWRLSSPPDWLASSQGWFCSRLFPIGSAAGSCSPFLPCSLAALPLATAGAHGVNDLIFYRVAAGIGLGGALPNAFAMTSEFCPRRRRATLVVLVVSGIAVGSILGGGLTATLVAKFGWRLVFIIGGALPLLLTPVLFLRDAGIPRLSRAERSGLPKVARTGSEHWTRRSPYRPEPDSFPPKSALKGVPVAQLFVDGRGPGTVLLWIAFFLNLMDFYFLQSWLPTIFTSSGLSLETSSLVATLISRRRHRRGTDRRPSDGSPWTLHDSDEPVSSGHRVRRLHRPRGFPYDSDRQHVFSLAFA